MDKVNPVGTGSFSMNRKADTPIGGRSHAEGDSTTASGYASHAEGNGTTASAYASHAEGNSTTASGTYSHAEGGSTTASGSYSHAEGQSTQATTSTSAVVSTTTATYAGYWTHAEGNGTKASGVDSHAEGQSTTASSSQSHAEGYYTTASGSISHAEGQSTTASGSVSHAEGFRTKASGNTSHAEGYNTIASGYYTHAEGGGTVAASRNQHVQGKYNVTDSSGTYAHIVGNGTSDTARSNAHTLDWDGLGWFASGLKVGGTGQDDEAAVEVALKTDIPSTIVQSVNGIAPDENGNVVIEAGGGGAVDSVNGQTGVVVLTASDVGALGGKTVHYWNSNSGGVNDVFDIVLNYLCGIVVDGSGNPPAGMTFPAFVIVGSVDRWYRNFSVIDNSGKFYQCVADLRTLEATATPIYPSAEDVGALPNDTVIPTDDHINSLIDTKLAAIPNAAEVAY